MKPILTRRPTGVVLVGLVLLSSVGRSFSFVGPVGRSFSFVAGSRSETKPTAFAKATASLAEARFARRRKLRPTEVETQALAAEIDRFLAREMTTHFTAIPTLDPLPSTVLNAGASGEFSWGTFIRALAAYADLSGQNTIGGRDVATWVGQIGLVEARHGSKAFSQMYSALALRHFGRDLDRNAVWHRLSEPERAEWRAFLDPTHIYDPKTRQIIDLAENYLGVAARIAALDYQLGLLRDRAFVDSLVDRAALQFTSGRLYADDDPQRGRFDRYSNEYARYVWEAAEMIDRRDLVAALAPTLKTQMRLWWDLVSPDGYSYPWGRSLGVVSYLDTLEIPAFLAQHPEFRPAPLADLASAYANAWRVLRRDYHDDTHMLGVFDFGRANYAYITRDREWQQTTGFFGKLAVAHAKLMEGLRREGLTQIPGSPALREVRRFEFFRRAGERVAAVRPALTLRQAQGHPERSRGVSTVEGPAVTEGGPDAAAAPVAGTETARAAGVWIVRQGPFRFALPFTTGQKPGAADYLPAPHGQPGFSVPVESPYPALVPFLELGDGRTIVTADGADALDAASDGSRVTARWTRWAIVGAPSGTLTDPAVTSEVTWTLDGATLTRDERLTASRPIDIRRWWVAMPSTANRHVIDPGAHRVDRLTSTEGTLAVDLVRSDWPIATALVATGNDPHGRGARGPIPLHLTYETTNLRLEPGKPQSWRLAMTATAR